MQEHQTSASILDRRIKSGDDNEKKCLIEVHGGVREFCWRNSFWRSLHGRAAPSGADREAGPRREAIADVERTSQGAGHLSASAGCAVTARLDPRNWRALPNGSAHPPRPLVNRCRCERHRAWTARGTNCAGGSPVSCVTRLPGGTDGDDTAQPCSDPDVPAGRLYARTGGHDAPFLVVTPG